jgi:hypothetical protein
MRAFVEACGCTINSGESREMVDLLARDWLQEIDSDPEFGTRTRLSIASAIPSHRTAKVDGAL